MFGINLPMSLRNNIDRQSPPPSWISFLSGVFSASLVWSLGWGIRNYWGASRHHYLISYDDDDSDDESSSAIINDEDSISENFPSASHKVRSRWPWDKIRRKLTASASFLSTESSENSENATHTENDFAANSKTGPCIGAIFGLDVGGTLAKLVYFEQQIQEYKRSGPNEGLHRMDHYHAAASAFEVLQARRATSTMNTQHNPDSDNDLQAMWSLRQESVPDRLDEFASSCSIQPTPSSVSPGRSARVEPGGTEDKNGLSPGGAGSSPSHGIGLKKSSSMVNLSNSTEHKEALDNFYSFARRLDTYETGVKDKHLSYYSRFLNGTFHFIRFETRRMKNAMGLMRINNLHLNIKEIGSTGGGSHKFANDWERELGITMMKQDEMDSLVAGMQFVMSDIVGECYTFKPNDWNSQSDLSRSTSNENIPSVVNGSCLRTPVRPEKARFNPSVSAHSSLQPPVLSEDSSCDSDNESHDKHAKAPLHQEEPSKSEERGPRVDQWWASKKVQRDTVIDSKAYPYLLVSIGTGVSILRVDGPRKHERISGSTIGGGTYWGLCRLLTGSDSFSDVLNLAMKGDPSKVDMMVGDIYGENSDALEKIGLPSNLVASSFGKLVAKQNPSEGIKEEDLARALLLMVTNNIGQVAHLNAQLHKTSRIYFVGTFLQHNTISQQRLAYAIDYWSRGKREALFLEHEGYFGALGAFLLNQGIEHHDAQQAKGKEADPKQRKKRLSRGRLHRRTKSMGSIPPLPTPAT